MFKFSPFKWIKRKRISSFLIASAIIFYFLFLNPTPSKAASGGRIGGGSFQAPSAPIRQNYGGYGSGYRRGGIGFPFLFPIFGFGGGGLFGFLILMSIVGVIVNSIKGASNWAREENTKKQTEQIAPSKVTLIQLKLGLLATAKEIQTDLRKLATTSNTTTSVGLQRILQETTLSLLRNSDLWVYSNLETGSVPYASAESTFNRISITERSKLKAELTSNFSGQINTSNNLELNAGDSDPTNEFILITIIIATKKDLKLNSLINTEHTTNAMRILGSMSSNDLIALEVIWQPDGEGESLSKEELITQHPNLKHL